MSVLTQKRTAATADSTKPASPPVAPEQSAAPVLITEQEVLLATAAVVGVPRVSVGRRFAQALRWMVMGSPQAEDTPRPHSYPRLDFLEDSRMSREMFRL